MVRVSRLLLVAVLLMLGAALPAHAGYADWPELHPDVRCAEIPPGVGDPDDPGGPESMHCQRLFWDLPPVTEVGTVVVSAPFYEDRIPRFPQGLTDRPPPLYVDAEGNGYESPGPGRERLCEDPFEIGYWEPLFDENDQPLTGTDGFGYSSVADPGQPQTGPLFRLSCRRATRAYHGPWQTGRDEEVYDRLTTRKAVRFDNTAHLDQDVAEGRTTGDNRIEWNLGTEFYNHFASHHFTCWAPDTSDSCNDPNNPQPREAYDENDPDAACRDWQRRADPPDHPEGEGSCYAATEDPSCPEGGVDTSGYRAATQKPGRASLEYPEGRGILAVEDQIWGCDHHVVTQLPPGSYGIEKLQNYRLQTRGVRNDRGRAIYGTEPGEYFGGAVGQVVITYFAEPANGDVRPINLMFNAAIDLATTAYPPFTWIYKEHPWYAPFDLAIGRLTLHSHHRMVKGTVSVAGGHAPRLNSPDPDCGGLASGEARTEFYTNRDWSDSKVCEYWLDPDGPIILRKGQVLRTGCMVNNGVTPEAIKQGLVAGSFVEGLRSLGAPIPEKPSTMPASEWSGLLVGSPIGQEFLYGIHPPVNYRVAYKCAVAGATPHASSPTGEICDPNPGVDADGDYVDGPYRNEEQCGGWCNPATIMFANRGEDEMCISVGFYWALDRIGNPDSHDRAMEHLENGDLNKVGTPGALPRVPVSDLGVCPECNTGL